VLFPEPAALALTGVRQVFQSLFFIFVDIATRVFRKTEDKNPSTTLVGGNKGAKTTAFALPLTCNPFFQRFLTFTASI